MTGKRPHELEVKKEIFNQAHSSIRSVIERSFGVLKMKWRILLGLPHYSERKQTQIILACCGLHNFILENDSDDVDFNREEPEVALLESDENDDEPDEYGTAAPVNEDGNMNALRDEIAGSCRVPLGFTFVTFVCYVCHVCLHFLNMSIMLGVHVWTFFYYRNNDVCA